MRRLKSNRIYKMFILGFCTCITLGSCGQKPIHVIMKKDLKEVRTTQFSENIMKQMGDTTVFVFESGFDGELITVYTNGISMGEKRLTTDESTGLAGAWSMLPINEVENVGFSINGVQTTFPLWNNYKYVFVNKEGDELHIQLGEAIPLYE